ncbi:transposase [Castellaniella hirudinis]|uniref:transposase n=1 Tax=Castellaniella hirudinis TaxID=1144617 RepID=UPI0039C27880
MSTYSQELKEQVVKKMMPPHNQSVAHLSRETGISGPTLYAWKKQFQTRGFVVPAKPSAPDRWDARAKLAAVIQTAPMNEAERSAYCRSTVCIPSSSTPGRPPLRPWTRPAHLRTRSNWPQSVREAASWKRSCCAKNAHWQRQQHC